MNKPEKQNKLQLRIDLLLTIFFLGVIFLMGIMTLVTDFEGIYKAAVSKTRLTGYLGGDWEGSSSWDRLEARVRSVDDYLAGNVYMSEELGYMNSSFQ